MHILPAIHRETRYLMPLLAIVLLGLSLIFVTWQNLRQQRQAVEQHMVLAARVVAMGIEGNMVWRMRGPGRMAFPRISGKEFLQELLTSPDLVLVGIVGPSGQMILASEDPERVPAIPHTALETLRSERQWHGFVRHRGQDILLYVHQLKHPAARHMHETFLPPTHDTREHPSYLVLGLDMSEHMVMYNDARRAALWQGGYVLATVVLLWVGAVKLLQRREQSAKVKELEHFQARLVDNLPDGLLTVDAEGVIRGANPSAVALLGDDEPLPGRRWEDLALNQESIGQPLDQDPGQLKRQREPRGATQDERNLETAVSSNLLGNSTDMSWRSFSFADRHLELLTVPLRADERELGERLVLVRDRTEIKKLEDSLQESERLAAIGRLAAAVAHEIRNPLSALRGFAQFFAGKLAGLEPEETYARTMVAEADRLNRVITDLLFLAKPTPPQAELLRLTELFESVMALLRSDLDQHGIQLRTDFTEGSLWADPDLLKQCLLNLLINAIQALTEAGSNATGIIEVSGGSDQRGTWIMVRDNGVGMDEHRRQHALEPFYTTRKKGSGLGLAIVHKIVRDHGGWVEISSEPGQGTRVSLFFPKQIRDAPAVQR